MNDEYETSYRIDTLQCPEGYTVYVSKAGGGTIGERYSCEYWDVVVVSNEGEEFRNDKLYVSGLCGHYRAASEAVYFCEGGE